MKAMFYDAFEKRPPKSAPCPIRRRPSDVGGHHGRGDRALPQRLARLDGPRSRYPAAARAAATNWPARCVATGKGVMRFKVGDRVTVPFVSGCGHCCECRSGNQQVCPNQFQPGFTHWGSFAEYVAIDYADTNLVHLPETIDFATAASLGCRFATSFRAVADQGRVKAAANGWRCMAAAASASRRS